MKSMMKKGLCAAALLLAANMANAAVVTTTTVAPGLNFSLPSYSTSFSLTSSSNVSLNVEALIGGFAGYTAKLFNSSNVEVASANGGGAGLVASALSSLLDLKTQAAGLYSLTFTSASFSPLALTLNATAVAAVPEPETYALMGVGLLGLLAARRKKSQAVVAA